MINSVSFRRTTLSVGLAGLLSGMTACAAIDQFGDRASDYNHEVRQSQNAGLITNVLRSMHRHPLQFTAVSTITGSAGMTGSIGLSLPFADADKAFTATPVVSARGDVTFTVAVLDTQEFVNGILTPINKRTLDYYIHQGFPRSILFYLVFERIDLVDEDGALIKKYDNFPSRADRRPSDGAATQPESERFRSFTKLMSVFHAAGLTTETVPDEAKIGPILPASSLLNAEHLVKIDQAGLELRPTDDTRQSFQLTKREKVVRFCFDNPDLTDVPGALCAASRGSRAATSKERPLPRVSATQRLFSLAAPQAALELSDPRVAAAEQGKKKLSYVFYTRSTEGIIYYLGELVRYQLETGQLVMVEIGRRRERPAGDSGTDEAARKEALFVLHKGVAPNALVRVSYLGETYSVQAHGGGTRPERTTQVLNIVSQLISMNRSSKDQPATSVITIVGR